MTQPSVSWSRLRRQILERDDWTCGYCGKFAHHVDHMLPRSRGGTDDPWNLVAACGPCNLSKHAKVYDWAVHNAIVHQRKQSDREAALEEVWNETLEQDAWHEYLDSDLWLTELVA